MLNDVDFNIQFFLLDKSWNLHSNIYNLSVNQYVIIFPVRK